MTDHSTVVIIESIPTLVPYLRVDVPESLISTQPDMQGDTVPTTNLVCRLVPQAAAARRGEWAIGCRCQSGLLAFQT